MFLSHDISDIADHDNLLSTNLQQTHLQVDNWASESSYFFLTVYLDYVSSYQNIFVAFEFL